MLTRAQIEDVRRLDTGGAPVVSFFLNLDKQHPDEDFGIRSKNMLRDAFERASRRSQSGTTDDHTWKESIRADRDRIRAYLEDREDGYGEGLAIFACRAADLWQVHEVPRGVETCVAIAPRPHIRPLIRLLTETEAFVTVIISRDKSRIFESRQGDFAEVAPEDADDVPGQHSQGGWSQARYSRHIEDHVRVHFQVVADRLFAMVQARPFDRLLVAGPDEVVSGFTEHLHTYLTERLVGTTHLQMEAGILEVEAASQRVLTTKRIKAQERLIDKLAGGTGSRDLSVTGLAATVHALQQGQVMTLVIDDTFAAAGQRCPQCAYVTVGDERECPYCLATLEPTANISDSLVETAFDQDARIVLLTDERPRGRLRDVVRDEPVGALLRFAIAPTDDGG